MNSEAVESLSTKILNKKCKSIIINTIYRLPNGDIETGENYFKNLFSKNHTLNKHIVLAGDFTLNVLDFGNFINFMFRCGMIPNINKPTRVTANTVTAMDHIITNVIIDTVFKTGILKSCISDHFAIMLAFQIGKEKCVTNQNNIFTSEFSIKFQ